MALSPLIFESSTGGIFTSRVFSLDELNYASIVVTLAKFDVRETWYRAGWIAIMGYFGNAVPSLTLISTSPLGINEPRLIEMPNVIGTTQLLFRFAPVFWLGEYLISIEGLTP